MDHQCLIDELPEIEKFAYTDRTVLARERRAEQIQKYLEREAQQQQNSLPLAERRKRPKALKICQEVALLDAAALGDHEEVEHLLMEGVNPNFHNSDGFTSLHQCAVDNNEAPFELLIDNGADMNAKDAENWTPLHAAARCGYIKIVRILIDHNADLLAVNADGNMPYDICEDEKTLHLIESEMAARDITQEMIDDRRKQPEREMLNDMKFLHQKGLALDQRNPRDKSTFLHIAAANGYADVAAFLLRCCNVSPALQDIDLWQSIHAASSWNQPDLIELLCEYGADINAKTGAGEMPLALTKDDQTQQVIRTIIAQQAEAPRYPGPAVESEMVARDITQAELAQMKKKEDQLAKQLKAADERAKCKSHEFDLEMALKDGEINALKNLLKDSDAIGGMHIITKLETRIHELETALANQLTGQENKMESSHIDGQKL